MPWSKARGRCRRPGALDQRTRAPLRASRRAPRPEPPPRTAGQWDSGGAGSRESARPGSRALTRESYERIQTSCQGYDFSWKKEDGLMAQMHARLGNKYAEIARSLPGRTATKVKNHLRDLFKSRTTLCWCSMF